MPRRGAAMRADAAPRCGGFGPDTAAAMRSGVDGLGFFTSVIRKALVEA